MRTVSSPTVLQHKLGKKGAESFIKTSKTDSMLLVCMYLEVLNQIQAAGLQKQGLKNEEVDQLS